jgi:hypothetical protein
MNTNYDAKASEGRNMNNPMQAEGAAWGERQTANGK